MVLTLGACTGTTTVLEAPTRQQSPNLARLYFLRPNYAFPTAAPAYIGIDGQRVGSVADGSYLFVDRPAGRYTLTVDALADPGSARLETQVRAGAAYYYMVQVNLPAGANPLAAFVLSPLEPQAGAAKLGQLTTVQNQ
jgi:hypothetical protein